MSATAVAPGPEAAVPIIDAETGRVPEQDSAGTLGTPRCDAERVRTVSVAGLFVLASFAALYVAKPILLPVVLAVLFSFLFAPIVSALEGVSIPRWVASALVLAGAVGILGTGLTRLAGPAWEWIEEAPSRISSLEERIRVITEPVGQVTAAADQVESALGGEADEAPRVAVQASSLRQQLMERARDVVAGFVVTLALVFFFLGSGDLFLRKLVRVLPRVSSRKTAVRVARRIRSNLSTHLLTITVINAALGTAVGLSLAWLGVPNPILWGVMAALLNYIPYLGAMAGVAIVAVVALTTFDDVARGILAPSAYLTLTALEGTFVTPAVLGRRMRLNPAAVFLGILFLGWIWGIPGALLAVPVLSAIKVIADAYPGLLVLSEFLGR